MNERYQNPSESLKISDYEDEAFYETLRQFPVTLASRHMEYIEREDLNDLEAQTYLSEQLSLREEAVTEMEISDGELEEKIDSREAFFEHIKSTLFEDTESVIGHGTTSRVCGFEVNGTQLAVKYVVSPNKGTKSAKAEHNLIRKFERIRTLEALESQTQQQHPNFCIPHPQFHFSNNKVQCYGMNKITGNGFDQIIDSRASDKNMELFRESAIKDVSLDELLEQTDAFFNTMHAYCIHGSIKSDNLMLSTTGEIYVIDFGNSILLGETGEISPEQLEINMSDEVTKAKQLVTTIYKKLFSTEEERAAA